MTRDDQPTTNTRLTHRVFRDGWTRERYTLLAILTLILLTFAPSFQVYLLTEFLIIALFAVGFNLLYGYTGLLSFGHAMFYAAGAYGLAITLQHVQPLITDAIGAGIAPLATYLTGAIVGILLVVVIAIPIGWLSVRLEEIYFALITLAFGMLIYTIILQDPRGLTNGTDGLLILLGTIEAGGIELRIGDRQTYYLITLTAVTISIYAIYRLVNSPFGTVCKAIRESPDRAEALGIDVTAHRWFTFILSALFVGIAGVLNAGLANVASPAHSHWTTSATPVVATVIGGATYFAGPIVGAFIFLYARWLISRFPLLEAHWQLVFGAIIVLTVLYFKQGAAGGLLILSRWLHNLYAEYQQGGIDAAASFTRASLAVQYRALRRWTAAKLHRSHSHDPAKGGGSE